MITVLTLCSANYLAHAMTLGDSVIEHNPDYQFVIGLVDSNMPKELGAVRCPYEVIPVESLGITGFGEMVQNYDLVELNTAVKPFYMEHLYRRDAAVEAVIYLDPDIILYGSFKLLAEKLRKYNLVVTPHSCTYDDTPVNIYYETGMLSTGIYNLGFLATSRSDTTFAFLKWWQKRLRNYCYYQPGTGLFVDQLWVTLAPLYFQGIHVETNLGYNMCYWNHFERRLSRDGGRYVVNGQHDLVFYHFSSYSPDKPDTVTKRKKAMTMSFSERPELRPLYDDYRRRLLANGYASVKHLQYALRRNPPQSKWTVKTAVRDTLRAGMRALPLSLQALLKGFAQFTMNSFK